MHNFIFILLTFLLSNGIFAMEQSNPVKVGDFLRTRQEALGDHVAVVVKCPTDATLDESFHKKIIVAENFYDGVKLVTLKEFIIKSDIHIEKVSDKDKSKPYLIVARAIACLDANIEYNIALKNCGLFAGWCLTGSNIFPADVVVKDFRNPACLSLSPDMNKFRYVCDGTPQCKEILVQEALKYDQKLAKSLAKRAPEFFAQWGYGCPNGQENLCQFILKRHAKIPRIERFNSGNINLPSIKEIVVDAFMLSLNELQLTPLNMAKLTSMSDDAAKLLCSYIVDADVRGEVVDVNALLEQLSL